MKNQYVSQLSSGDKVKDVFGVYEVNLARFTKPNRTGDQYLRLLLGDRTGIIEGRIWDTQAALDIVRDVRVDDLVMISGTVQEFNGLQININTCRKVDRVATDMENFRPQSEKSILDMWKGLDHLTDRITGEHWRRLIREIWSADFKKMFQGAPAGRQVHHNYGGGLLEHTLEVMIYCEQVIETQGEAIDSDTLLMGALVHDIGKVEEYDAKSLTFQLTEKGKLLGGHIILGRDMVQAWMKRIRPFPDEAAAKLEHMILSHHGIPEWGSPVEPKIIEAIALHHADLLSARVNQAYKVISQAVQPDQRWSPYDKFLGRSLLVPTANASDRECDGLITQGGEEE